MANAISAIGKTIAITARFGSYGLGLAAAVKTIDFLYEATIGKAIEYMPENDVGKKIKGEVNRLAEYVHLKRKGVDARKEDLTALGLEILSMSIIAWVIHDLSYYALPKPSPKLFNTALSFTPVKFRDSSIIDALKETYKNFNVRSLFLVD